MIQTMKLRSRERYIGSVQYYSCAVVGIYFRNLSYLSSFFVEEASSQKVVQVKGDKGAPLHPLPSGYQCHYLCQWYNILIQ